MAATTGSPIKVTSKLLIGQCFVLLPVCCILNCFTEFELNIWQGILLCLQKSVHNCMQFDQIQLALLNFDGKTFTYPQHTWFTLIQKIFTIKANFASLSKHHISLLLGSKFPQNSRNSSPFGQLLASNLLHLHHPQLPCGGTVDHIIVMKTPQHPLKVGQLLFMNI